MVNWPAVIKYSGEDELLFIESGSHWISDDDLTVYPYHYDDVLLDSNGELFSIDNRLFVPLKKTLPINEFELWIKNHMVILNQCCSSKLSFAKYSDGLLLVGQLSNESSSCKL